MPITVMGVQLGNITGGPSPINLSDLNDVSIVSPQTGQYLRYNGTISEWQNAFIDTEVYNYLNTNLLGSNGVLLTKLSGPQTIDISLALSATGDATGTVTSGALPLTLATVNADTGVFGSSTTIPVITVNAKGLITGASSVSYTGSASSLSTTRSISVTGDATWSVNFNGTADVSSALTLATVNSSPQTLSFVKLTVNGKGLVTQTTPVVSADITTALGYTPVNRAGDTMTGNLILNADPVNALGAATKQYVDNTSTGLIIKDAVVSATDGVNLTATYDNGTAGVGATLTGTGALPDVGGITLSVNDRVLIKDQTASLENGIYDVTQITANWILTRSSDFDNSPDGEVASGAYTFVQQGTLSGTGWILTTPGTIVIGTTPIDFTQFSGGSTYTAGDGIALIGNEFSNTGVLSNIAGTGISVSGSTGNVTVSNTGVTSVTGTSNRLTASASTGSVTLDISASYVGQSSITTLGTISAGTWNGTTIAIANGGTGQTTQTTAFNALNPTTTKGDIIVNNGTNAIRLPVGTNTHVLTADSAQASGVRWAAAATGSVSSVDASGGTTGMSFSGGPITTSGVLTLAGNLAIANGGTGQITANAALNAFLPSQASNSGRFLTTDGTNTSWGIPAGGVTGLANPTGTVGLSTVNGSATTAMRSDGAPALSQSISPTWTGPHIFSNTVALNGGTTIGDASGDAFTINSSAVSIPNGLNFDSNTLVIDATNDRTLFGTNTARPFSNTGYTARVEVEGTTGSTAAISSVINSNSVTGAASVLLGKTRGTTVGSTTIVQDGDTLGLIAFAGSDGTNLVEAVRLTAEVNGTPGSADMPGRFSVQITGDGQGGVSERFRFTTTELIPTTGSITLGSASNQWSDVRSVLGTFTGNVSVTAGDVIVTRTTSSSTALVSITNTSNTAGSQSLNLLSVGGSSAGDPYIRYNISGVLNWAIGVDNSDSDAFVISRGQEPGTNNVLRADATGTTVLGALSVTGGNFDVTRSASGAVVLATVANTSNTASSDAGLVVSTAGTSAGDCYVRFNNGGNNYILGIDNSASDALVGSVGSSLGTNDWLSVAADGAVTFPDTSGVSVAGQISSSASGAALLQSSSTNGSSNSIQVFNTSNTASSDSVLLLNVAGASGGDAYVRYNNSGVSAWSHGYDNSDGDSFVISFANALGTNNVFRATTSLNSTFPGGAVTFNGGNIDVTRSANGVGVSGVISNTSNTASSDAVLGIFSAGSSGGDAYAVWAVSGVQGYTLGIDNSDNDAFVGSVSSTIGTSNWLRVATDGSVTFPDAQGVNVNGGGLSVTGGQLDVTRAASGTAVATTIFNTSNTASSDAFVNVVSAGAGGGDAYIGFTVSSVQSWTVGLDNSNSDAFTISPSSALGTTPAVLIGTTGSMTLPLGNFAVTRSNGGSVVQTATVNTSDTASSDAKHFISTGGTSAGDPYVHWSVSAGGAFVMGIDNSDSDSLVISVGSTLGTSNALKVTSGGVLQDGAGIELGYRSIPRSTTTTTAVVGDRGKCIAVTANITIPNATFAAGDAISIYNDSGSAITIIQGASLTLRLVGTATTGNRVLAQRGFATIWFNSSSDAVITGGGLS